jgi:hypothetical protein
MRIVSRGILGEAPGRTVFKPLVDREDHELAGAAQCPVVQDAREAGFDPGSVVAVPVQYGADSVLHGGILEALTREPV